MGAHVAIVSKILSNWHFHALSMRQKNMLVCGLEGWVNVLYCWYCQYQGVSLMEEILMSQPLSGIRILDLSRLLPGAYASQLLADFGADVIKVEEPGSGDYGRFMPPHGPGGMSLYFTAINRNK